MTIETIPTLNERRRRNKQEIRENILAISRALMRENGVAALSFNEIARQLGMKPPSLYTYFPSKMAIYDALFRQGMEMFAAQMEQSYIQGGSLAEMLQASIEAYVSFATENPELFQLLFERPVPGFEPSEESMAVSWAALQKGSNQVTLALSESKLATDLPVETIRDLVIAMEHGITALHLANSPGTPISESRFGSLIPHAVKVFVSAWQNDV